VVVLVMGDGSTWQWLGWLVLVVYVWVVNISVVKKKKKAHT
jgi:hypothetical protein